MSKEVRLGLFDPWSKSKPPVLQFMPQDGFWRLWTSYDSDLTKGTCIELHSDGTIMRQTILPDTTTIVTEVK